MAQNTIIKIRSVEEKHKHLFMVTFMSFSGSYKTTDTRKQASLDISCLNLVESTVGQDLFLRAKGYDPIATNGRATTRLFFLDSSSSLSLAPFL